MGKYNEIETQELFLYTINCGDIYRNRTQYYLNNLKKKALKGNYDQEKAAIGFEAIALIGARHYAREFCNPGDEKHIFSRDDRKEAAIRMEEYYREGVLRG